MSLTKLSLAGKNDNLFYSVAKATKEYLSDLANKGQDFYKM